MRRPHAFWAIWLALLALLVPSSALAQGWIPTPRGSTGSSGGGGITCPVGDLSTGCYVQSIGGANNAGGVVTLGPTVVLTASAGTGGLSLGNWTGDTSLPTGSVSWSGAAAKTLSLVGQGAFTLTGGASSVWGLSSGTLRIDASTLNLGTTAATTLGIGNALSTTNILGTLELHTQQIPAGTANGQLWEFNGTNWTLINASSLTPSVTGTGYWFSVGGVLHSAAVTDTGDVTQGAISGNNVPLEVTGLLNNTLPSLTTCAGLGGYLLWNGTSWTCGTGAGSGVTFANDLTGTNTSQTVVALSGSTGVTTLKSNLVPDANNTRAVGTIADALSGVVALTHSVYHTTTDTQPTARLSDGAVGFGPGGTTALNTRLFFPSSAHTLTLDDASNGPATFNVGGTSQNYISILSTGFIESVGTNGPLTLETTGTGAITMQIASYVTASLDDSNSDYIAFGNNSLNPVASSGWIRIPNNIHPIAARNSTNTGDDSLVGADASDNVILGGGSNLGLSFYIGAQRLLQGGVTTGSASLTFDSNTATTYALIGFTSSSANPAPIGLVGEQSTGATSGGSVALVSGSRGTGADGNVVFQFNGTSSSDSVQFNGATTSAGRGNLVWSTAITPKFTQNSANFHNANAFDWTWAPQANTDGSSTSGRSGVAQVNLSPPPGTSTTESWLSVQRNSVDTVSLGPLPGSPTIGAAWFSTSFAGTNETNTNWGIAGDSGSTYINGPGASGTGTVVFRISDVNLSILTNSGWGGSSSANQPYSFQQSTGVSIAAGGTITLTAAQYSTPIIGLSGIMSAPTVIALPAVAGGFYLFSISAVSGINSTNTLAWKCGSSVSSIAIATAPAHSLVVVACVGANNVPSVVF